MSGKKRRRGSKKPEDMVSLLIDPRRIENTVKQLILGNRIPKELAKKPYWQRAVLNIEANKATGFVVAHAELLYGLMSFMPEYQAIKSKVHWGWYHMVMLCCEADIACYEFATRIGASVTSIRDRYCNPCPRTRLSTEDFYYSIVTLTVQDIRKLKPSIHKSPTKEAVSQKEEIQQPHGVGSEELVTAILASLHVSGMLLQLFFDQIKKNGDVKGGLRRLLTADTNNTLLQIENGLSAANNPDGEAYRRMFGGGK